MNLQTRPKLFPPLALLAATSTLVPAGRHAASQAPRTDDLRRLVAAMVD